MMFTSRTANTNKRKMSMEWKIPAAISCAIVIILCIAFGIIFYNTSSIIQNTEDLTKKQLEIVADQTCNLLSNCLRMSRTLSVNGDFKRYAGYTGDENGVLLTQDGYTVQKNLVSLISVYGENINTLAAYFPNSNSVVTMARQLDSASIHLFFNDYPEIAPEYLTTLLVGNLNDDYFISTDEHNWIIYKVANLPAFILVEYNVDQLVSTIISDREDMLVIIGDDISCIYSNCAAPTDEEYQHLLSEATLSSEASINNRHYYMQSSSTTRNSMYVLAGLPADNISRIQDLLILVIFVVTVMILTCSVLMLSRLNRTVFSPLNYLIDISGHNGNDTQNFLYSLADELIEKDQNQALLTKERDNLLPLALGRALIRLNETEKGAQSLSYAESCLLLSGLPADHKFAMFSIIFLEDTQELLKRLDANIGTKSDSLLPHLVNILNDQLFCTFPGVVSPIQKRSYAVILSCHDDTELAKIDTALQKLVNYGNETLQISLVTTKTIRGVGSDEFDNATKLMFRDIAFIKFWGIESESTGETYEGTGFSSYSKLIYRLLNSLNAQNYENVSEELDFFLRQAIPTEVDNIHIARHRIYAISAIIVTTLKEQFVNDKVFFESLKCDEMLNNVDNIISFRIALKNIFSKVIERKLSTSQESVSERRMGDIKAYIIEHYKDNGLSVSSLATQFNVSVSYLSRTFKEAYNVNVLEYIQHLRIVEAKRLLQYDNPIQVVAREVGFWDTQGLSRAFKKLEGISPGEYKRLLEKEKNVNHDISSN